MTTSFSRILHYTTAGLAWLFLGTLMCSSQDQSKDLAVLLQKIDELDRAGKYREAIPIAEEHLQLIENALGADSLVVAASCNSLGDLYRKNGDYAKAEPVLQRGCNIREKALGPEHPDVAKSLNSLGELYYSTRNYAKAEPLFQRALAIRKKALRVENAATAESTHNLGRVYDGLGDYAKAKPFYESALKIREKVLGPEHPDTAKSLYDLAYLYKETGDYTNAEIFDARALKIREKALGSEHPDTAKSLNSLALLYDTLGDYAKAEPLFQRALKINEKVLGPEHPYTALNLNNLALLYRDIGNYAKAEPLFQRALKINEKAFGPDDPATAGGLNNLALLYKDIGDYAKAEPLYQRALKIREKLFGPKHPATAGSLSNLAVLYSKMGDYRKAEPLYERARQIFENTLGPEHPDTAGSFINLGQIYINMGEYAKAQPLYQRALRIFENALGPEHPVTTATLSNLALVYVGMAELNKALDIAVRARHGQEKNLADILSFTSEEERLAFEKTTEPYTLLATLRSAPELAEIILRQKGVVLDSLLEDRLVAEASADLKQRVIVDEVRSSKQHLIKLVMEVPRDFSEQARQERDAEKEKLSARVEELESGLARQVAGLGRARRALSVTVPQVRSALPQQAVLIELLRYSYYLGKDKYEPRYGAIVLAAKGEPHWVPLGSGAEIEKNVALYQKSVRGQTDEATLSTVLKALEKQVWAPIEKAVPEGTRRIVLSPDAQLNFVSFATLLGADDKFVAEKCSVSYVASGRDLLREGKPPSSPVMLVYANPDFGGKIITQSPASGGNNAVALRSVEMRDLQNLSLTSLPGTAAEAEALEKRMGKSAKVFLGSDATEAELKRVNSPRILHLATHGFFLPEVDLGKPANQLEESNIPKGKLVNPMHRSGLALAGAQKTLEAWSRGEVPPTENDGIVTAEEVGGLKLDGTWLVVLSACDTGSGEARAGEGVMGLRRGFIQAGAQNLLMTLWPISDQTTVQIMLDFYDAAEKSKNAAQALADVQRDWLVRLRKERGLLNAVRLAGPFIISSQGKQ